ncbi:MAG: hypothetical protein JO139_12130 [Alphaproteobacteria bacterium]|nr:hypothetical protein [Alphaproteobacteria bacterium]
MLAQEDWEVVRFPAIAEEDEAHAVETVWGPRYFTRRRGEALHSEREPTAMLVRIRRTIGEYNFADQYQQAIGRRPRQGGVVQAYTPGELPENFERIVQSGDTASKATELSDFSVYTTWGIAGKDLYLRDVLRKRMEYPELKRAVRDQHERFGPSVVLIEEQGLGHPADPGADPRGPPCGHPLSAAIRHGHADACTDRDDRERLCPRA